jgi:hypothetical protein
VKITIFNGSPRAEAGNTHVMVEAFMKGAREGGAEVENVFLARKEIKPCRGCFGCWLKTPGECVIKDDMAELFEKDEGGECAHLMRSEKRVKLVVISNCGFPEQSHFQVLELLFKRVARNMRTEVIGEIYRGGGAILKDAPLILKPVIRKYKKLLQKAGKEIAENLRLSEETRSKLEKPLIPEERYIAEANEYFDKLLSTV